MYERSAPYYDLIYRELKNYREEASQLHALLQKLSPPPRRLLDVACGTGSHAHELSRTYGYQVDGIDIQTEFVAIARGKLPESRFETADMRAFNLGQEYDAVLCLFSSIGYTETIEGLGNALSCLASHVQEGGWLICEPWLRPEQWKAEQVDSITANDPNTGTTLMRTRLGETEGRVSILKIDYEVEASGITERFSETHRLGLFTKAQMNQAMRKVGLKPLWLPMGLQSESLIVAQKLPKPSSQARE